MFPQPSIQDVFQVDVISSGDETVDVQSWFTAEFSQNYLTEDITRETTESDTIAVQVNQNQKQLYLGAIQKAMWANCRSVESSLMSQN